MFSSNLWGISLLFCVYHFANIWKKVFPLQSGYCDLIFYYIYFSIFFLNYSRPDKGVRCEAEHHFFCNRVFSECCLFINFSASSSYKVKKKANQEETQCCWIFFFFTSISFKQKKHHAVFARDINFELSCLT